MNANEKNRFIPVRFCEYVKVPCQRERCAFFNKRLDSVDGCVVDMLLAVMKINYQTMIKLKTDE